MAQALEDHSHGGGIFETHIFLTDDLVASVGTAPELVAADYLSTRLSEIGVSHTVRYGFETIPINNPNNSCPSPNKDTVAYEEWVAYLQNADPSIIAKDSNMLLNNADGGGCSSVAGNAGVISMAAVDHHPGIIETVIEDGSLWRLGSDIYGFLHEVGHNMGFFHSPHPGITFMLNGVWHKTPCVGSRTDTENLCGAPIDPEAPGPNEALEALELWYADCVAQEIEIATAGSQTVIGLETIPADPVVGETVTIEATVENTAGEFVTVEEAVLAGDTRIGTLRFDIAPNSTDTDSIQWAPERADDYLIQVNQQVITVTVTEPDPSNEGSVRIDDIVPDPPTPTVGDTVIIEITATNPGATEAREHMDFFVDGQKIMDIMWILDPGETDDRLAFWDPESPGNYTMSMGDASVGITVADETGEPPGEPVQDENPVASLALLWFLLSRFD